MSLLVSLARGALSHPTRHTYAQQHPVQVADLHLPRGGGPFPVAVVLHGGHWQARYGKLTTRLLAADLAHRGWAAWNVEYRRLGGGQGGGWPATFLDVAAAVDHLAFLVDPRLDLMRVVVVGHSSGGLPALWAAGRPGLPEAAPGADPRVCPRGVVALAPVTELTRAGRAARELLGGTPVQVPDRFAQADPIGRVPLHVPTLLVHAADDTTIDVNNSRAYVVAARIAGDDATFIEATSGGHKGLLDPGSRVWNSAARWLSTVANTST
ncbi:MAG: alpha/beta hydrolase family protein [Geodermatophilaceae bacterium]